MRGAAGMSPMCKRGRRRFTGFDVDQRHRPGRPGNGLRHGPASIGSDRLRIAGVRPVGRAFQNGDLGRLGQAFDRFSATTIGLYDIS